MIEIDKYFDNIENLLSVDNLNKIAEQFNSQDIRVRKLTIDVFFWTILLTHNTDLKFGGLNKAVSKFKEIILFKKGQPTNISRMAFSKKLSKTDWKFFQFIFQQLVELYPNETSSIFNGTLINLKKIDIIDSTTIKLFKALKDKFPSNEKHLAQLKIHTKYDLKKHIPHEIFITNQKTNDKNYEFISNESDVLYIFDLGYWSFKLFDKIISSKNYFVSRLRNDNNPKIVSDNPEFNDKLLRDILLTTKDRTVDFKCQLAKYRSNPMKNNVRVVGVKVEDKWHLYATNLTTEEFTPENISNIYYSRWQIEIFFNELKHYVNLNKILSHNENGIMIEIYSSLIYYTLIQTCILLASEESGTPLEHYSFPRTAIVVKDILSYYKWVPIFKNFSSVLKYLVDSTNSNGKKDAYYIKNKLKSF